MVQNNKTYYAYTLIQMIKHSRNKRLNDPFFPNDFNIYKMNFIDSAIGSISVIHLQDILSLINTTYLQLRKTQKDRPTYKDMRNAFAPSIRKEVVK